MVHIPQLANSPPPTNQATSNTKFSLKIGPQWFQICVRVQYAKHTTAHDCISCPVVLLGCHNWTPFCLDVDIIPESWDSFQTIPFLFSQVSTAHTNPTCEMILGQNKSCTTVLVAEPLTLQNCWGFSKLLSISISLWFTMYFGAALSSFQIGN